MIIDRDAYYGRIVVYDGPYTAHRLAQLHGCKAKHSGMSGSHFDTFSVVLLPTDKDHLRPSN